jgi:hypothetical protein
LIMRATTNYRQDQDLSQSTPSPPHTTLIKTTPRFYQVHGHFYERRAWLRFYRGA